MTIITLMKTTVFAAIVSIAISNSNKHIVNNDGVDKIKMFKSSLKEVRKAFPNGEINRNVFGGEGITHVRWMDGGDSYIKTNRPKETSIDYVDSKEGISFHFNFHDTLGLIKIWGRGFVTDRGVILKKSTFHDIDSIYGRSDWYSMYYEHGMCWLKEYRDSLHNIIMFCSSEDTVKVKRSETLIVDHIVITFD